MTSILKIIYINNTKSTWKGIRSIISLQKMTNDSPKIISLKDHTVTDLQAITNIFNSFLVPFSYKSFYHHLTTTRFSSHLVQEHAQK